MPLEEIPFFEDPDYSQNDIESFQRLFAGGCEKRAIGTKRPNYLHKPECPERIAKHIPDARLILVLRDPVDRAVSAYYHFIQTGFAPVREINRGLPEIIRGQHAEHYPRAAQIIEFGFYHRQLRRYLDCFPREQMLILLYDDLRRDPVGCLKSTFRFLGVDETYRPASLSRRPNASLHSLARLRLQTLANPIRYTYSSDRMRMFARERIGALGSAALKAVGLMDRAVLSRVCGNTRPRLSPALRKMLSAIYREDTSKLVELLGVDLGTWKVFRGRDCERGDG